MSSSEKSHLKIKSINLKFYLLFSNNTATWILLDGDWLKSWKNAAPISHKIPNRCHKRYMTDFHSFSHSEDLYSTPTRKPTYNKGDPSPTLATNNSFQKLTLCNWVHSRRFTQYECLFELIHKQIKTFTSLYVEKCKMTYKTVKCHQLHCKLHGEAYSSPRHCITCHDCMGTILLFWFL